VSTAEIGVRIDLHRLSSPDPMQTPEASSATQPPSAMLDASLSEGRSWSERLLSLPSVARSVRAIVVVAGGLRGEPITLRAGALTYLSVLSLLPLLAVVFSLFQAVVGTRVLQDQLREYIVENLAVGARESFERIIEQSIQRATGAKLGGFGFAFLLASAVSLIANVESAFNQIFRAPRPRPLALRFGVYWCLLTLGPVLLSLSVAGTALLERSRALGSLRHLAGFFLPLSVTCGAFFLLYVIVPAVRVQRRAALVGALVAGTAWEVAKIVYTVASAHSVRRDALYGSLSAIPTFLLWVYVSWIIVLFGARIAYAAQATHVMLPTDPQPAPLSRELLVARVMHVVAKRWRGAERRPSTVRAIAVDGGMDEALVRAALDDLKREGLVSELAEGGWVPARPLEQIALSEVRRAARGTIETPKAHELPLGPLDGVLLAEWRRADAAAGKALELSLAELLERTTPADGATAPGPVGGRR
jgi:membrane protein